MCLMEAQRAGHLCSTLGSCQLVPQALHLLRNELRFIAVCTPHCSICSRLQECCRASGHNVHTHLGCQVYLGLRRFHLTLQEVDFLHKGGVSIAAAPPEAEQATTSTKHARGAICSR